MDHLKIMKYANFFSTEEFSRANYYDGNDLGAVWTKEAAHFKVWAPTAEQVLLNIFKTGDGDDLLQSHAMTRDACGTWAYILEGDCHGVYYTYNVTVDGETKEAVDPYAKAVGVNGLRGMVVDLSSTDPEGFQNEERPYFENPTDAVIYEIHVRDFSADQSSGMVNKGKYLAFTEEASVNPEGIPTGLKHLKELGVTHIHLLPSFDFATVDEASPDSGQYNWGYDPQNYNVPEGSYSTDPFRGETRIMEFKQMIMALHRNGIRVIMDVVYNHTFENAESDFNRIVPGYYYRMSGDGYFSNASGCGCETASERPMMRKFMLDSVVYWAQEYHIDGFRFDLMGIHDIRTMNEIRKALDDIDPGILMYGEGWTGGLSPLPEQERAVKSNIGRLDPRIAVFSDNLRDGIKGSVFSAHERGFVSGRGGMEETIKFGVTAATPHDQIDYNRVWYSNFPWAAEPTQCVNYVSAHDNLTLWDKLTISNGYDRLEDRIRMNLLSAAILFTSQGIPFIMAGEEFLRSKPRDESGTVFDDNSYRSPDFVNSLKWNRKSEYIDVFNYYRGLIAFRRAHKALRLERTEEIRARLRFLEGLDPNVVAFTINNSEKEGLDRASADTTDNPYSGQEAPETICVIYNANREPATVMIPHGEWKVFAEGIKAGNEILETITGGEVVIEPVSAMILGK